MPDLGYYYDALDYTFGGVIALEGAQITVLPGTAIGLRFDWWFGFDLWEGSSFISQGTPTKPNTFVPVSLVQEGPYPFFFYPGWVVSFVPDYWPYENYNPFELQPPNLDFRFSNFYQDSGLSYHLFTGMNLWFLFDFCSAATISSAMNLNMQDCNLHSGWIDMGEPNIFYFWPVDFGGPVIPSSVSLRNNLFDRININLDPDTSDIYWWWLPYIFPTPSVTVDMSLVATNNLFHGGYLYLEPVRASAGNWTFENNLFDQVAFAQDPRQPLNYDYNAYWGTPQMAFGQNSKLLVTDTKSSYVDGANDVDLTTETVEPPYQSGPLGDFYLPNTTLLYGAGHGLPGDVGLFHYTTRVDETKEGNETAGHNVNIGLHYIATTSSTSTQPYDYDADGIPDYVEDANGNGSKDAGETGWQDSSDPGADSTIYDDLDLDGDGLIGRIEKALGENPLVSHNPLTLTQVITGEEPHFITFEVPVNYDLLTNVASLYLNIDGRSASLVECNPAPNRNCWLKWNTYYDAPGQHCLAAMFVPKRPRSGTGVGPLISFNSPNIVQFYEACSGFDSGGASLVATIPTYSDNGYSYSIELLDPENASSPHIKTINGNTSTGLIQEYWDLTYDDNITKFSGSRVDAVFSISPVTQSSTERLSVAKSSDSSASSQTLRLIYWYGLREGDFDVAYGDNGPEVYLRKGGEFWNQMQGVVDILLAPRYGIDTYYSDFDVYYYDFNGYPGYITSRAQAVNLKDDLAKNARNFYIYAHGGPQFLANTPDVFNHSGQLNPDACCLSVSEVADSLNNKLTIMGESDFKTSYRFVFLDGCSTAETSDWQHAFGVRTPPPIAAQWSNPGYAQAFMGWDRDIRNCGAGEAFEDSYGNYGDTLAYFFGNWMNGRTLDQCIRGACLNFSDPNFMQEHVNGRYLPFATIGNEHCLLNYKDVYVKYVRETGKLKLVGYPGLTKTGCVPGSWGSVVEYPPGPQW